MIFGVKNGSKVPRFQLHINMGYGRVVFSTVSEGLLMSI